MACPKCGHPNEARPQPPQPAVRTVSPYASIGRRLGALVIDNILLGVVAYALFPQQEYRAGEPFGPFILQAFFTSASAIFGIAYRWLMITFVNGQTFGKMVMRIRVARPDGRPVDLGRSLVRSFFAIFSGLFFGLGFAWALWDPQRRTWHDIAADTRVFPVERTPRRRSL